MPLFHALRDVCVSDESSADIGASMHLNDDSKYDITSSQILAVQNIDHFQFLTPCCHARFLSELIRFWTNLPSESVEACSDLYISEALELLDITNIPILITAYFEQWQRHSPVLHPSFFDPNTVSFPLLLSVILVGAFYSSDEQRIATAQMLIPVAEEWVFISRIFTKQRSSPRVTKQNSLSCTDKLSDFEALQAAFIMIKILLREGDTKKTNEIRTTMFDQVIPVTYPFNTRNCVAV